VASSYLGRVHGNRVGTGTYRRARCAGNDGQGGWRYPQHNGYVIEPDGKPLETQIPLVPGHSIDRYGSEYGS
jgi:hypothetical protein